MCACECGSPFESPDSIKSEEYLDWQLFVFRFLKESTPSRYVIIETHES